MKLAVLWLALVALVLGCNGSGPTEPKEASVADVLAVVAATPRTPRAERAWCGDDDCDAFLVVHPANPRANKDTRTQAEKAADACWGFADGRKAWRCRGNPPAMFAAMGQTPVIPSSWRVASWFFDNANSSGNASDFNDCITSATPCATWGEIWVHRLGAGNPQLQQATTFNQLSSQTLNVDPIFGTFQLQNGDQAILKGQRTQVCTIPINTATVTAQVRGGPGTRWQVSNPCAGEVAKTLLQDTTQNTYAFVDSVAGTATISQPLSSALLTTVGIPTLAEASMATNDAFTVWSLPLSNLKS